jgi:DNA-directed RNA polymerase subunit RPC12/RpoP
MKCALLKQDGTVCGAGLSLTQKYCANCSGEVEIDESKTKKCPDCSKRLILTDKFCTECRFSYESVTKKTTCDTTTRLRKEDGMNYIYFSH